MFNLLVESTDQSRRRTPRYFLLTFLVYGSIMGSAVIGSIMFYRTAPADLFDNISMLTPQLPQAPGGGAKPKDARPAVEYVSETAPPTGLESTAPRPEVPIINLGPMGEPGPTTGIGQGIGPGVGPGVGVPTTGNVAPAPEPVKPAPLPETKPEVKPDNTPHKVSEGVALGNAINIPKPEYPRMALAIHGEGAVRVE